MKPGIESIENQITRQTILIVDDQPLNVDVLYGILQPDYRVKVALNGEQALKLAASDPPPDLILLDIMMPGMDGYEVCRRLKANPFTRAIPIIFVTALSDVEDESKGFKLGAVDYITKPVSPPVVQARMRTHLALYDQNRALEDMVRQRTAELQRANQKLRQERARFEWMLKTVDEGYLIVDQVGKLLYANPKSRLYLGLSPDDAPVSGNLLKLARQQYQIHPTDWEISATDQPHYLVRAETYSAHDFWLQMDMTELPGEATDKLWVVRLRDVTEQLGSWRDRSTFVKMAHHKLRTPLATIIGGLDMLAQYAAEMPPAEMIETSQFALAGARRLQSTVEDILAYLDAPKKAREPGASGGFSLRRLPALLTEIAVGLHIQDIQIEHSGHRTDFMSHPEWLADTTLAISERAVEQVLWELLENARKFHPSQTPAITVRLAEVAGNLLRLQVCDDGLHLSPEQLAQIWQPFYQGEKYFTGELPGTGLGLATVAAVVWGMEGTCRAFNREDRPGLVVDLCLPVRG